MRRLDRATLLHLGVIAALFALSFVLPAYHHGVVARVLVLIRLGLLFMDRKLAAANLYYRAGTVCQR